MAEAAVGFYGAALVQGRWETSRRAGAELSTGRAESRAAEPSPRAVTCTKRLPLMS